MYLIEIREIPAYRIRNRCMARVMRDGEVLGQSAPCFDVGVAVKVAVARARAKRAARRVARCERLWNAAIAGRALLDSEPGHVQTFFGVEQGNRETLPPAEERSAPVNERLGLVALAAASHGTYAEPRHTLPSDPDLSWLAEEDTTPSLAIPTWVPSAEAAR